MLAMEEILCELGGDEINNQGLPPGFRFHPTDEELITFYLASKVLNGSFCGVEIAEIDLNRCEPWELPDVAKMGEREWYFFSLKDRKYPTGLRTNRATCAGYWKATGKDREIYSSSSSIGAQQQQQLVGMKKTLVFYKGRAPRGEKTKWVMHEYRLDGDFLHPHTCKEEWVICRIFHKMGEKKNPPPFQGQSHILKTCSSPTAGLLPPLLEAPTTLMESQYQNRLQCLQDLHLLMRHQDSELETMMNPIVSQFNQLLPLSCLPVPPTFSPITSSNSSDKYADATNLSPTNIVKSMLANQNCNLKEATDAIVTKQCKTEASFPYCQASNDSMRWPGKSHHSIYQSPNTSWTDFHVLGFPSLSNTGTDTVVLSRAGSQMLADPAIGATGDSWPLGF